MLNVSNIVGTVTFFVKKNEPKICFGLGVATSIVALVETAKAAPKWQQVYEEYKKETAERKEAVAEIKEGIKNGDIPAEKYTKKDWFVDAVVSKMKLTVMFFKMFWKPILMEAASIASFLRAFKVLTEWFTGAVSALVLKTKELDHLEEQVAKKYGEEELKNLKAAGSEETVIDQHVDPETGKTVTDKVSEPTYGAFQRVFDNANPNWERRDPASNRFFLERIRDSMQRVLDAKGYVFLNDVLEALGFEKITSGNIMGWKKYKTDEEAKANGGSNRISFGVENTTDERAYEFINGDDKFFILTFNVDKKPILSDLNWEVS